MDSPFELPFFRRRTSLNLDVAESSTLKLLYFRVRINKCWNGSHLVNSFQWNSTGILPLVFIFKWVCSVLMLFRGFLMKNNCDRQREKGSFIFSRVYFFNYLRAFKIHLFYGCIRTFIYMHINTRMDDGVIGYIIQDGMERKNLKHFRAKLKKKSSRKKKLQEELSFLGILYLF